ncbi:hypothetical protein OQA88_12810 [Cercophora sp. LCS_1]
MGTTTTIWSLPVQPAPEAAIVAGTFVTIWLFVFFGFAYLFHRLLRGPRKVWPEFKHIRNATLLLAVWYTFTAASRWVHQTRKTVPYGYILLEPVLQILQVGSTIWYLSGTYIILWNELERQFGKWQQTALWLTAQFFIFVIILMSLYEVVLDIAAAVVWLQFFTLNIIADVTTKRNQFELAMAGFFAFFAALTLCVAIAAIIYFPRKREGALVRARLYLLGGMLMLFGRSLAECIFASQTVKLSKPRLEIQMPYDITFGTLTLLYLCFMYAQACQLLSKNDTGRPDVVDIQSDIRAAILEQLWVATDHKILPAPAPSIVLDKTAEDLDTILENGPRSCKSTLTLQQKQRHALKFIAKLRKDMARFEPQIPAVPETKPPANGRSSRARHGRQSAPLLQAQASSMYHSLVDGEVGPAMRTASSAPNMRRDASSPFTNGGHQYGPDIRQREMQRIEENAVPQAFTRRPVAQPRYVSADLDAPSFQARAKAANLRERDNFRAASDPIPQQRRQYAPRGRVDDYDGIEVPEDYAPRISPQFESGTTLGEPADDTPSPHEPVDTEPQGPRRRYMRGAALTPGTAPAPPHMGIDDEPKILRRPFPVDLGQQGFQTSGQPVQDYDDQVRPRPQIQARMAYAETVTDTEASTRSPVNWTFDLPDLGRKDEFPLTEIQALTDQVLNPEPSIFSRKHTPPRSDEGDGLLVEELAELTNELYTYEAAVVGCFHLLTYDVARGFLRGKLKPDLSTKDSDEFFNTRISVYLQCVIIAERADSTLVHEGEARAAKQLLRILHKGKPGEFPHVLGLLATITDSSCEELLPFDFLAEILRRAQHREKLKAKLRRLQQTRDWTGAYSLIDGLQGFSQRPDLPQPVRRLLPELFSEYAMWASWRPNLARIRAWDTGTNDRQKSQLAHVFDLEGPDTTPQQRSALRFSSEGAFAMARAQGLRQGDDILDYLLNLLDRAVSIGPSAVDLFIEMCPVRSLTWELLIQLEIGLSVGLDSVAAALCSFIRALNPRVGIRDRVLAFCSVLPSLNRSAALQAAFGIANNISSRARQTFADAQKHFCQLLSILVNAESFGRDILALGRVLLDSNWLFEEWPPAFIAMLKALPSEGEMSARFKAIQTAKDVSWRQEQVDYLALCIGGSDVDGQIDPATSPMVVVPPIVVDPEPIWSPQVDNDPHRTALRKALGGMKGLNSQLAAACLERAEAEHDAFVKDLVTIIVGDSDQACVNLAKFLVPRVKRPATDDMEKCNANGKGDKLKFKVDSKRLLEESPHEHQQNLLLSRIITNVEKLNEAIVVMNRTLQDINIQNMNIELVAQMFKNYQSNVLFHLEATDNLKDPA